MSSLVLVKAHLNDDDATIRALSTEKLIVVKSSV